jgi:hypothetical protein
MKLLKLLHTSGYWNSFFGVKQPGCEVKTLFASAPPLCQFQERWIHCINSDRDYFEGENNEKCKRIFCYCLSLETYEYTLVY